MIYDMYRNSQILCKIKALSNIFLFFLIDDLHEFIYVERFKRVIIMNRSV